MLITQGLGNRHRTVNRIASATRIAVGPLLVGYQAILLRQRQAVVPVVALRINLLANFKRLFVAGERTFGIAEIVLEIVSLHRTNSLISGCQFPLQADVAF